MTTTLRIFFEEAVGLLVDIEVVFESITGSDFLEGFVIILRTWFQISPGLNASLKPRNWDHKKMQDA